MPRYPKPSTELMTIIAGAFIGCAMSLFFGSVPLKICFGIFCFISSIGLILEIMDYLTRKQENE